MNEAMYVNKICKINQLDQYWTDQCVFSTTVSCAWRDIQVALFNESVYSYIIYNTL